MVTLDRRRRDHLLEAVRRCAQVDDLAAFQQEVLAAAHTIVSCAAVAYNEVRLDGGPTVTLIDPPEINFEGSSEILARHAGDNPLITHYARTADGHAHKLTDFMTLDQLRATDLYNLLYRRLDVDRQMAIALPSSDSVIVGLTVNRSGSDFSEEDRLALNLFRPHVVGLFSRAVALSGLTAVLEQLDAGVLIVSPSGRIAHATPAALGILQRWFPPDDSVPTRLPEALQAWLAGQRRAVDMPVLGEPARPYTDHRGPTSLTISRVTASAGHDVLRLVEDGDELTLDDLAPLGLTQRQAEVLLGLVRGHSSSEIASRLDTQPATVRKHVEHVFNRLRVTSRAEAVAAAYRAARRR